jgi:dTDP-4-dehydrorhamnose reductase
MNLLILGANGMLGKSFEKIQGQFLQHKFFFKSKKTLDILNTAQVKLFIQEQAIDILINCAAYTNVNETIENLNLANEVNGMAVGKLAALASSLNVKMIHFSTDYVFDGNTNIPYKETAATNPVNDYGKTKLLGEILMNKANPKNSLIIRTSWLYDAHGANFTTKMLDLARNKKQLSVVNDQYGSPTYATDLALTTLNILPSIDSKGVETYHFSNKGICTWFDYATKIMEINKSSCKVKPVSSDEFPSKVTRPKWSVLDTSLIQKKFNFEIPYWETSLNVCILNNLLKN